MVIVCVCVCVCVCQLCFIGSGNSIYTASQQVIRKETNAARNDTEPGCGKARPCCPQALCLCQRPVGRNVAKHETRRLHDVDGSVARYCSVQS